MKLGKTQIYASPEEALAHVSETPWSNWTKADYTLEQWHAACLIHTHDGAPTSKSECKLPVKTPDGTLNRNGVHAAAAALAGARGGLKGVSAEQKSKAAGALRRYYSQLDEDPPKSLAVHSGIDCRTKPGSPGDILEHHGVKGMKWGVRKEEELVGRTGSSAPTSGSGNIPSAEEYHRLAEGIAKKQGVDPNQAAMKYGPPKAQAQAQKQHDADREKLKKIALAAGIGLGAAAVGVAVYKLNQSGGLKVLDELPPERISALSKAFDFGPKGPDVDKLNTLFGTKFKAYNNPVEGLNINWDNGVELPAGSIIRRLSSAAETVPRPEGFFASHLDNDVDSYKAILPTFWREWGAGSAEEGGFLNHYQAKDAIRAPSGRETFDIFKNLLGTNDSFKELATMWLPNGVHGASDKELKDLFGAASASWNNSKDELTQAWFKEVKSRGYNALIDFNDAGILAKTPLRVIDGNMFDIVKNEPQSLDDFYTAAKNWSPELIHIYLLANGEYVLIHVDDFLRKVQLGRDAVAMMSDR